MLPYEASACYRLYAAHCVEIAQHVSDSGNKATLLTMAQAWLVLADRTERTLGNLGAEPPESYQTT